MFEDAEPELHRILQLVDKCPEPLKGKCFEILLAGYVNRVVEVTKQKSENGSKDKKDEGKRALNDEGGEVPEEIRVRFNSFAKRIGITSPQLAHLFDFSSDPFTYHALQIPGEKKSIQTRNVALLVAAKNYLITGQWNGDWKEFRAMCVDQNCYDRTNISAYMKSDLFKTASSEENITLSAAGQKAAETLLKQIAHPTD